MHSSQGFAARKASSGADLEVAEARWHVLPTVLSGRDLPVVACLLVEVCRMFTQPCPITSEREKERHRERERGREGGREGGREKECDEVSW